MIKKKNNKIWAYIVIIVVAVLFAQVIGRIIIENSGNDLSSKKTALTNIAQLTDIKENSLSGDAAFSDVAEARLCINSPPHLDHDCNLTDYRFNRSAEYDCTVNATDPNGDPVTFYTEWITSPAMFNISSAGNINFTPPRGSMGQKNTFRIHTVDNSGCSNNDTNVEFNVSVTGDNSAPYLFKNIPDQQLVKDRYSIITTLNDFFKDPDNDPLTYFSIMESGGTVEVKISGSQVMLKGINCGVSTVYFVAVDPFGLSANSNTVTYNVTCTSAAPLVASSGGSSSGGGSGGGSDNSTCRPNWKCSAWSPCNMGNFTYRRCLDYSGCSENYEHYIFDNCTYTVDNKCAEDWECNDWSACENNIHTRMCLDMKTCGTNNTRPLELESCNLTSCFDGLQDGNETGIDCGGECGACKNIESPSRTRNILMITLLSGTLIITLIGMTTFIFRKRLALYFRKLGKRLLFKRKVYINDKQKEKLLQILNVAQSRLDRHDSRSLEFCVDELAAFIREYFRQLLAMEILDRKETAGRKDTFEKKELIARVTKLKNKDLEAMLVMLYAKISSMNALRSSIGQSDESRRSAEFKIQALIDEFSHDLYLIAEFTDEDALKSAKDRAIDAAADAVSRDSGIKNAAAKDANVKDSADKISEDNPKYTIIEGIYNRMSNIYIALKFRELIAAKNDYKELLKDYDTMSKDEKDALYNDIIRLFHAIDYLDKEYKQ